MLEVIEGKKRLEHFACACDKNQGGGCCVYDLVMRLNVAVGKNALQFSLLLAVMLHLASACMCPRERVPELETVQSL